MMPPSTPTTATIGALMLLPLPDAAAVLRFIKDDDPADPKLRSILGAIRELVEQGITPDATAVDRHLLTTGAVGRSNHGALAVLLTHLVSVDVVPIPRAVSSYAMGMIEETVRRQVAETAANLGELAERSNIDRLVDVTAKAAVDMVEACARLRHPIVLAGAA